MKRLNSSGFTITELVVVITVISILILVIGMFLINNLQQSTLATIRSNMLHEAQQSLDLIANDIRLSANADATNRWSDVNGPGGAANPYSWHSNQDILVLATAAEDSSGGILFVDAKNYITQKNNVIYFVNNKTLYKRTLAATGDDNAAKTSCPRDEATVSCPADKELIHNVKQFQVTYKDGQDNTVSPTDARSVELAITIEKPVYRNKVSVSYDTRMVFRND